MKKHPKVPKDKKVTTKFKKIELIDKNLEKQIELENKLKNDQFIKEQEEFTTLEKKLEEEYKELGALEVLNKNMNQNMIRVVQKEKYQEDLNKKLGEDLYSQEKELA